MRYDLDSIMTRDVVTIEEDQTVYEAVKQMDDHDISCLVVTHDDTPVGMITEKDMTRKVVAKDLDPKTTPIRQIMSTPLISAKRGQSIADIQKLFKEFGFRRIPVMDNGKLLGIVTTTDISNQTGILFEINGRILYHQKIQNLFMVLCLVLLIIIIYLFMKAGVRATG